jgi:excisionase family DNA binding protein
LEDVVRAGDTAMSASGHGVPVSGLSVPSLIGVGEAARRLRVSEWTVRRWTGTGRLPARRVGGRALLIEWRPDGLQGGRAARDGAHG